MDVLKILIKNLMIHEEFKRFSLFKELQRQKIPIYGSNNQKIIHELNINKPLINRIFEKYVTQENLYKNLERKSLSNAIRMNNTN